MDWFDAHLDLAYLSVNGRRMQGALDPSEGPSPPGCVTLGTLREGGVRAALATIFTEADGNEPPSSYPAGDAAAANRAGLAQLAVYHEWARLGLAEIGLVEKAPENPKSLAASVAAAIGTPPLRLGILIEGADPVLLPSELAWWVERGVVAVGLAWAKGSRYAEGNSGGGVAGLDAGLSPAGKALIKEMDRLGVVHDLSHLSDRAADELLSLTAEPVMASHSNARSFLGTDNQRHLRDDAIREITRRGGVIGLNLYSPFLTTGDGRRATIAEAVANVERVCELVGHRRAVGLGSDMDGGFSALKLPEGIEHPRDLRKIAEALGAKGWSDEDVRGFAHGNWERFWGMSV